MESVPVGDFSILDVSPGTKRRMALTIGEGLNGPVWLPALVARGRRPGRTLVAVAGVHGDEYEGMEAIRQVFAALNPDRLRGAFLGIPIANPFAYEARARVAPLAVDGLNLARIFPGDPAGSPSRVLAHELLGLVTRHLGADDLFLDLHSGSADVQFASLIGFRDVPGPARAAAEEAARYFGLPRLWRIPDSPGPFNAETARRGIVTLGTETTGRAGCDPSDVAEFASGLRNLLTYLGILTDVALPARDGGPARPTTDVLSPATGFLRTHCRLLAEVDAGDLLGTIVSPFGDPLAEITSPLAGTVWASRAMPAVRNGELAFMIAARP